MKSFLIKSVLAAFGLLFCLAVHGQGLTGRWRWQAPHPTKQRYMRFFFRDSLNGYAASHSADFSIVQIHRTFDGGMTWRTVGETTKIQRALDVAFPDSSNGWVVQGQEALTRTRDGGATWGFNGFATSDTTKFTAIRFRNTQHAIALAYNPYNRMARIYYTFDGGGTWGKGRDAGLNNSEGGILRDVCFINDTLLYAVGTKGHMIKSRDGGRTWAQGPAQVYPISAEFFSVCFLDTAEGWVRSSLGTLHTMDGGVSWTVLGTDPYPYVDRSMMKFFSRTRGYMTAPQKVAITNDGGATWTIPALPENVDLVTTALPAVLDSNTWILGNSYGRMYKTYDAGRTYRLLNILTKENFYDVKFTNDDEGWVVGGNQTVMRTQNGGRNWEIQHEGANPLVGTEHALLSSWAAGDTLQAIGPDGLLTTYDGGNTWEKNTGISGKKIVSIGHGEAWVQKVPSGLFHTTNGGRTWQAVNASFTCRNFCMLNSSKGYAVTTDFKAVSTVDGGRTWQAMDISSNIPTVIDLTSPDPSHVMFGGQNEYGNIGLTYVTSDGGLTWEGRHYIASGPIRRLQAGANGRAWTVIGSGKVLSTADECLTWRFHNEYGDLVGVNAFHINPNGASWLVQDSGMIARFYPGDSGIQATYGSNIIEGYVYKIADSNCVKNETEQGLSGHVVRVQPGSYYVTTNADGFYRFRVDSGTHTITTSAVNLGRAQEVVACPPVKSHTVRFTGRRAGYQPGINFGIKRADCPFMIVSQSSTRWRPCFKTLSTVRYENLGGATARDVVVWVERPTVLHSLSVSHPYTYDTARGMFRFEIGDVASAQEGSITMVDSVTCDMSLMDQEICLKAIITPGNFLTSAGGCVPVPDGFDGSDIVVKAYCAFDTLVFFSIRNRGATMSANREYRIFLDTSLIIRNQYQLAAGDSLYFAVSRTRAQTWRGMALRLEADQHPRHPISRLASATDFCFMSAASPAHTLIGDFPQGDESSVEHVSCNRFVNSMDPNDKRVAPAGIGTLGKILPKTKMDYTIRFMNKGSDTAYTVVVVDTLSDVLDLATLEMGASTHSFQYTLTGKGKPVLKFIFQNIRLIDSVTNASKSQGAISFRIRPKDNLALGTRIENYADIYFDYNEPVRTNTTLNTLYEPAISVPGRDSVVQVPQRDWVLHNSPGLAPAYLTACDTGGPAPVYLAVTNLGSQAADSVTIRLRDEATGLTQTQKMALAAPLLPTRTAHLLVPYHFGQMRDYRLMASAVLPDSIAPHDSLPVRLPYGRKALPHTFSFDTCALGRAPHPLVRGFAFESTAETQGSAPVWSIEADGALAARAAVWAGPADSTSTVARIVTLPVGPLGRYTALRLRWRTEATALLPDDRMTIYAHSACGGRQRLHQISGSDAALWHLSSAGSTLVYSDTVAGLRLDSAAYFEVEFSLVPGALRGHSARVLVGSIEALDARFVSTESGLGNRVALQARPNPTWHSLWVTAPYTGPLELLTLQGKQIMLINVQAGQAATLSLRDLPVGMYILRQQEHTLRVVKE